MYKRKVGVLVLCIVLLVSLMGCARQEVGSVEPGTNEKQADTKTDGPSGAVMLYSSMQEAQIQAIIDGFTAKYPNIEADFYFAGTGKVVTKIATEHQSGQVAADVIWAGDPSHYVTFIEQDILEKYVSPETDKIADQFRETQGFYTGARLVGTGIGYNLDLVSEDEIPRTWDDLLDPKWANQIIMTDPGSSGTTNYLVSALMAEDEYGLSFFEKLKANGAELESGTTATHNKIAAGAYKVGLCLDYVSANLAKEGGRLGFVYPEKAMVTITSPIALIKNSANNENGKLLIDYILSKEGQEILVENNLISVRDDVEQKAALGIDEIKSRSVITDDESMAKNANNVLADFDEIFK